MASDTEPCLTLDEAAELCRLELFPSGRITNTEMACGRLNTFKIAGRVFTTRVDLLAMIEAARREGRRKNAPDVVQPAIGRSGARHSRPCRGTRILAQAWRDLEGTRQVRQASDFQGVIFEVSPPV